jgi:peptide/nickel transport system substrate-binding protein
MLPMQEAHVRSALRAVDRIFRSVIATLIILLPGAYQTAKAAQRSASGESVAEHNRLVVCLPGGVVSFDPANHRSRITQMVLKNIFDSLTTRDSSNRIVPQLAESWRLVDNLQWEFKLRRGVRFHDGHELSAADVQFSLNRVIREGALEGATSPRRSLLAPISEVRVQDHQTVWIRTAFPWPNLPLMLSLQEIVPAANMQASGARGFESHPVGTGPFRFVSSDGGRTILLERFEGYFGGIPESVPDHCAPLKQLVFKVVPSLADQVAMLKTGRCDIIFNLPPASVPILEMVPGLRVLKGPATKSYFAEINCLHPPLDDRRVRQALNYAVDVRAIVRHKLQGHGKVLPTVLLPNAFGYDFSLQPYPYDLPAARRLLAAAAYPGDRPLIIYSNQEDLVFADSIALFLTKLGLRTRMETQAAPRPQTVGMDAPWDIFVGSWGNSTLDPAGILPPKFESRGPGNYSGFASPALDSLLQEAQRTMDRDRRASLYHRIQALLHDEAPMIFGYAQDEYYGVARRVENFTPSATGMLEMRVVHVSCEIE